MKISIGIFLIGVVVLALIVGAWAIREAKRG